MKIVKMSAAKSRLLAYLKYTPGFEKRVYTFIDLPIDEILDEVKTQDFVAYELCLERFRKQGTSLLIKNT